MRKLSYVNFLKDRDNLCETLVITCVDFRFRKHLCDLLSYAYYKDFDFLAFPGASRAISDETAQPALFKAIETVIAVHQTKRIVIVDHTDCGAYGGSAAFKSADDEEASHFQRMNEAYSILKNRFPSLDIQMAYMDWAQLKPVEPTMSPAFSPESAPGNT